MAKKIKELNVKATLETISVGETIRLKFSECSPQAVRVAASVLKKDGMEYKVTQSMPTSMTTITRVN